MANNNQRVPAHRTCGAAEVHHRLMESREYQANRINIERHTARFMLWGGRDRRAGLITVPTVVHVVYGDSTQSISDAQVQSQIDVLNLDYRAANPDRVKVPQVWSNLAADA